MLFWITNLSAFYQPPSLSTFVYIIHLLMGKNYVIHLWMGNIYVIHLFMIRYLIIGSYLLMGCDFSDANLTSDLFKMGANFNLGLSKVKTKDISLVSSKIWLDWNWEIQGKGSGPMEEEGMVTQAVRKLEMGVVVFIFLQIHCNSQTAASHKCITKWDVSIF